MPTTDDKRGLTRWQYIVTRILFWSLRRMGWESGTVDRREGEGWQLQGFGPRHEELMAGIRKYREKEAARAD
jgi:hypothetical protein